jgi:hypothetical protein
VADKRLGSVLTAKLRLAPTLGPFAAASSDSAGREVKVFAIADELPTLRTNRYRRPRQVGICIPVEIRKIARKVLTFRHGFL